MKECNELFEERVRFLELRALIQESMETGDHYIGNDLDNEMNILKNRIQVRELIRVCRILEVDWKEIRGITE